MLAVLAGAEPLRHQRSIPERGPPSPRQGWVFPFRPKENPMFAVPMTRELRHVPVLLGGSGLARSLPMPRRTLPALFMPRPCLGRCDGHVCSQRAAGG